MGANRLTKQSVIKYEPGRPYVPAIPPRCYTVEVTSTIYQFMGTATGDLTYVRWKVGAYNKSSAGRKMPINQVQSVNSDNSEWLLYYVYTKTTKTTICSDAVPEQPAIPARTSVDSLLGWNAGARSREAVDGDFRVTFRLPRSPIGAACGVAATTTKAFGLTGLEHGVMATASGFSIIEGGIAVATPTPLPSAAPEITITRTAGVIAYAVGAWTYTSSKPSSGSKRLLASLYAAGDFVEDPDIEYLGGAVSGANGGMNLVTPPALGKLAASAISGMSLVLPAATMEAYGGVPTVTAGGMEMALPFYVGMSGSAGAIGGMDLSTPPARMLMSEGVYGEMRLGTPPAIGMFQQSTEPANHWAVAQNLRLTDTYVVDPVVIATLHEGLTIGDACELMIYLSADLVEALALGDEVSAVRVIEALLSSGLGIGDTLADSRRALIQYATNIATGAVTRYENFGFTGFARVGMRTFGVRPDGLYELTGTTDDGSPLSAAVSFAIDEFGTPQKKFIDFIYLGLSTDGDVLLKVTTDDGKERVYRPRHSAPNVRAQTAKGVSGRYWQLQVEIADATEALIENVEWSVGVSARRLGR
ncbi:hypothetical protein [Pseudomonas sp. PI1]|uniref:hypothetical protein n=1 Tax=Pseudomonas sp. PI1 TaxID=1582493 RepID=UPI0005BAD314|nr:hypothetical protein [Pseudomonas sp. PI1]KWR85522.1 hypothetical protein RN02_02380 [Pseudomonas sp. PI1]